ncbi:hypothetical protein [Lederbergia panacisoli]|uniref:hypothetical protein n=1 Tax=Lederbergia panacisoli TaxID=1255251 RepID=UPI00214B4A7F|nr:hypothetical protein [Lederbergia panacisoli]MCR2823806.1 hypothetical protein [Lederbergia panacisoli]
MLLLIDGCPNKNNQSLAETESKLFDLQMNYEKLDYEKIILEREMKELKTINRELKKVNKYVLGLYKSFKLPLSLSILLSEYRIIMYRF